MSNIMRNPQKFLTRVAQSRWRSLSALDPLERRVARLTALSLSAQQHLIQRTATDKLRSLGKHKVREWSKEFFQNWEPKRDFAYAMLHAERLTRILMADVAICEILLGQARQPPRAPRAARALPRPRRAPLQLPPRRDHHPRRPPARQPSPASHGDEAARRQDLMPPPRHGSQRTCPARTGRPGQARKTLARRPCPVGTGAARGSSTPRRRVACRAASPPPSSPLSARVGENAELFAQILGLHVAPEQPHRRRHLRPRRLLEEGPGRRLPRARLGHRPQARAPRAARLRPCTSGVDCRALPHAAASLDAVVLDPPYMEGMYRRAGRPHGRLRQPRRLPPRLQRQRPRHRGRPALARRRRRPLRARRPRGRPGPARRAAPSSSSARTRSAPTPSASPTSSSSPATSRSASTPRTSSSSSAPTAPPSRA
jgi:hypothetical protein